MSNIIPYNEMEKMALATAKSGLFGLKSQDQALTLMMIAQSEDIHPIRAVMEYDIIGGKPALKATTVLSRFQQSGGTIEWIESNDKKAVAKFTHPQGGSITITWTIDRAEKAGLMKNDTWKKFPDQMLRARCIPEGVRAIYPACLSGMYSSDEVAAFVEPERPPVDDTPFLEAEVEEPKPVLKVEKSRLVHKLEELQLSTADIKAFAAHFDLGEDVDTIVALNNDESLLVEKVKEFEGAQQ
jgi:hypothetical protein